MSGAKIKHLNQLLHKIQLLPVSQTHLVFIDACVPSLRNLLRRDNRRILLPHIPDDDVFVRIIYLIMLFCHPAHPPTSPSKKQSHFYE